MSIQLRFHKLLYILFCMSVILPFYAKAAPRFNDISGKITDKATGAPIAGATISIPDLKIATSTDANGIYTLKQLPVGEYLMQVTAIGYASVTKVIDLGDTYSVDVKLSMSNY